MASFLLVRAVSNRFIDAARGDPDIARALLDGDLPPPEWNVNAVRDHQRGQDGLARVGVSFDVDAGKVHDLDRAWDGLQRTLQTLGIAAANIFRVGVELGDAEVRLRVLTSTETSAALDALDRIDRDTVEDAVRQVLQASRTTGKQRLNPFTRKMENVGGGELYGIGNGTDEEIVTWLVRSFESLRGILRDARDRGFGLVIQIVL